MKTILAPIDFSPASKAVMAEAAELARAFHGRLVLLNVLQSTGIATGFVGMVGLPADFGSAEKTAQELLAEHERRLTDENLPVESAVSYGDPASSILDRAKTLAADFIVMGSHGHTALYELLLGSTTHGVLLKANCPVVIVRADASAPTPAVTEEEHARV